MSFAFSANTLSCFIYAMSCARGKLRKGELGRPKRIDDFSSGPRDWSASAMPRREVANAAVTSAVERTKLRRESSSGLDMRRPAFLVLAPPHLHCFGVVLNSP